MRNIIKIKDLNLKYDNKKIFDKLNLDIREGEFIGILGLNGTGKSSLIKVLVGLIPYEGYININGYILSKENYLSIRRFISVLFDDTEAHFIGKNVKEDLAFNLENLEYSKEEINKEIKKISSLFELDNLLDKTLLELTNSERQKVAIASSIIHKPKVVVLDEALYELNYKDKKLVLDILLNLNKKENTTIILITLNIEDVLLSKRIIVLNEEKIYLDFPKEKISEYEKELERLDIELPFIISLSKDLILYDLIDKIYYNQEDLVNKIWN